MSSPGWTEKRFLGIQIIKLFIVYLLPPLCSESSLCKLSVLQLPKSSN